MQNIGEIGLIKISILLLTASFLFSGAAANCSDLESEARDYLLEGEEISNSVEITSRGSENVCVYKLNNSKLENDAVIISIQDGDMLRKDSTTEKYYESFKIREEVLANRNRLQESLLNSEQNLDAIRSELPEDFVVSNFLDRISLRVCPVKLKKARVCGTESVKNFISTKSCKFFQPRASCIDWTESIDKIQETVGTLETFSSKQSASVKQSQQLFAQLNGVEKFVRATDPEVERDLTNDMSMQLHRTGEDISSFTERNLRNDEERISKRETELEAKRENIDDKLSTAQETLMNYSSERKISEDYHRICDLRDSISEHQMNSYFDEEDYADFEAQIQDVRNQNPLPVELEDYEKRHIVLRWLGVVSTPIYQTQVKLGC